MNRNIQPREVEGGKIQIRWGRVSPESSGLRTRTQVTEQGGRATGLREGSRTQVEDSGSQREGTGHRGNTV